MPPLAHDPDHDIDVELRHLLDVETRRYLVDAAPAWTGGDDPEV